MTGPPRRDPSEPVSARDSDEIRGRVLAAVAGTRALTLIVSGIPTMLAWAIMSKQLDASAFAGVSLALTLPAVSSFVIPAMGAGIANSVALGRAAFEDAVARSVRGSVLSGSVLVAIAVALAAVGWSRLLGRPDPDPFPMDAAVVFVSTAMAVWIVLLIGERILIARGEVRKRILASALTGPLTLAGVLVVWGLQGPDWAYVIPLPCAMIVAASCSLLLALRLPGVSRTTFFGHASRRRSAGVRRSTLTLWLIVAEAAVLIPIWMLRPTVSVRGTDLDVASLSIALQFATPVFSVIAVVGQGLWPFYAHHRQSLAARDVYRHIALMGAASLALAVCYGVGLWALFELDLVGHRTSTAVLLAVALTIMVRGCWEPPRIVFSTERTARPLAALCVTVCLVVVTWIWLVGGVAHGALAVLGVSAAFGADALLAPALLMRRVRAGAASHDADHGIASTST